VATADRQLGRSTAPRRADRGVVGTASSARTARRRRRTAATLLLGAALAGIAGACALAGRSGGGEVADLMEANAAARGRMRYGLTKREAMARMGEAAVRPPWANSLGLGPQVVRNPFDELRLEAPGGEVYDVLRYAVALDGDPRCPFVRGEAELVPLIFVDDQLVGWRWSYLESALQRRLRDSERGWSFGGFCPGELDPSSD